VCPKSRAAHIYGKYFNKSANVRQTRVSTFHARGVEQNGRGPSSYLCRYTVFGKKNRHRRSQIKALILLFIKVRYFRQEELSQRQSNKSIELVTYQGVLFRQEEPS
jgi:hypothetical protein